MIAAYAHHGCGDEAISLFKKMCNLDKQPNDVTNVGLLAACSHAGLVDEGLKYLDELTRDNSIQIRQEHYACLVDLCGRAGKLMETFEFIQKLPTEPSANIWGALLAECNVHGNTDIGKLASMKILEVEPENTELELAGEEEDDWKWEAEPAMWHPVEDEDPLDVTTLPLLFHGDEVQQEPDLLNP
ncbi:hypothetical protein RHSIM_Rhsim03G0117300 [Rhododendron simsii]|uniref:Pentatricopeptide repeat-containing protein n=1 Tax=Rhododendron simsii TaxID=118357 RepID=A0A834H7F0_RHOSS|nr:hypothetical protein RHSIM_Rhsim03G0117300 [Rhododendron simsii]